MNRTGCAPAVLMLAALVPATPMAAHAQGLASGTGMQPSTQLATPPSTPAIDRPGAESTSIPEHARAHSVVINHPSAGKQVDPPSTPTDGTTPTSRPGNASPPG